MVCMHDRNFPQAEYNFMLGHSEIWVLEDLLLAIKLSQSGNELRANL